MASTDIITPAEEVLRDLSLNPPQAEHASPGRKRSPSLSIHTPSASIPRRGHFYTSSDQQSSIADFIVGGGGSFSQAGDADDFFRTYEGRTNDDVSAFGTSSTQPQGPNLAKGFVEYISDLEARVRQLEAQLSLRAHDGLRTPDTVRDEEEAVGPFEALPFRFEMKFFEATAELELSGSFKAEREAMCNTFRSHVDERHFLRVAYLWRDAPGPSSGQPVEQDPMPDDIKVFALRIDSAPVTRFLSSRSGDLIERGPVIELVAPFRILIENYHPLRSHLVQLQADAAKNSAADTQEAISHFHLILQFMDLYLGKDLGIYEDVKQAKATKISFENLWMLFGYGETLFCPLKRGGQEIENMLGPETLRTRSHPTPQAYRVLGSIGGLPLTSGIDYARPDPSTVDTHEHATTPHVGGYYMGIRERFGPLYVYCFYIDFDGKKYGAAHDVFLFKPFEGEADITSLEAYPVRFLGQTAEMDGSIRHVEDLVARGRKFIDLTVPSHMNYEGWTTSDYTEEITSPVMVDVKMAFQESPSLAPRFGSLLEFWPKKTPGQVIQIAVSDCVHNERRSRCCNHWKCMRDADVESRRMVSFEMATRIKRQLESDEMSVSSNGGGDHGLSSIKARLEEAGLIQLLPGVVHGYALRNRKWISMDIALVKPVPWTDGWKSLVLPAGHKQLVQAMIDTHSAGPRLGPSDTGHMPEVDLVRGKGKGCIILIHGAPGVGKTSTAECVAAYTNRPLFPITCGDIGYEPEEVERKLERLFNLGLKWGCVLLLDEADTFLSKRSKDDVKRNGLVSVFLRILEYYSGILFLTTNRVGAIDDAFRSRLHLTLYYPRLDKEKSIKVWKMNIKRMQELGKERELQGKAGIALNKKRLLQFAADNFNLLQWNGRQIRNSFQTALALAEFEARKHSSNEGRDPGGSPGAEPKLSVKHFRTIALASQEFEEYLQQTHGRSEEKQAHYDKMRAEDFKDPGLRQSLKVRESSTDEGSDATSTDDDDDALRSGSSESDSNTSGKRGGGKKGAGSLGRVKSRDSILYRPNMSRQKSRDSIISVKKGQKKRSSLMEDEGSYPAIRRQKSRDSIVSLKRPSGKKRGSFMEDEQKKKRKSRTEMEVGGESDSDDSNE